MAVSDGMLSSIRLSMHVLHCQRGHGEQNQLPIVEGYRGVFPYPPSHCVCKEIVRQSWTPKCGRQRCGRPPEWCSRAVIASLLRKIGAKIIQPTNPAQFKRFLAYDEWCLVLRYKKGCCSGDGVDVPPNSLVTRNPPHRSSLVSLPAPFAL